MSTKYFEWGVAVAGGDTPVVPAVASYGTPEDFSGIIMALATEVITFSSPTKSVKIQNTHDTESFTVSVDGGITFRTIGFYGEIEEPIMVSSVTIVGGTGNSSYYVRGTLTE